MSIGPRELIADITAVTNLQLMAGSLRSVSGGDINQAYQVTDALGQKYFLKLNDPTGAEMFAAEQTGLQALARAEQLRVPLTIANGYNDKYAWLLLEWLNLTTGNAKAARHLGKALANLHHISADGFGFDMDNTIGRTPQTNGWDGDWLTFYRDRRLKPQLELAIANGAPKSLKTKMAKLFDRLGDWFQEYTPVPALLHGDLWGGNWAMLSNGQPVVFDPAAYFGDREADIAMTMLFGGFPNEFYVAYEAAWPLDAGAERRRPLYNLYHVLNHFNLFGGSYLSQADRIIAELLAQDHN